MTSIPADYLAVALMAIIGILFPFGGFFLSYFIRPTQDPNDSSKMRSILIPGFESDQSLYVRRLVPTNAERIQLAMLGLNSISNIIGMQSSSLCLISPSCSFLSQVFLWLNPAVNL